MFENLISFLESIGVSKAAEQVNFIFDPVNIPFAIWETLYAPFVATVLAYVIGLPLGVLLVTGEETGIRPMPKGFMTALNTVINLLRSIPFLILMVMVFPLSRLILGTSIGTMATIVPLTVAAAPYVARLVESSLREMDRGVVEAAQSMGASTWQIVTKVLLPESLPSLISGGAITMTTILGYGAMAGVIGGGGLGKIAIDYGYYNFKTIVMWAAVIGLIVLVQIIQSAGTKLAAACDKRLRNRN